MHLKSSVLWIPIILLVACAPETTSPHSDDLSESQVQELRSADMAKNNGDMATAEKSYRELISHSQSSVSPHLGLAVLERKQGHAQEAVAIMQDAQKRQPENPDVLKNLGYALVDANHNEEAVAVFDHLIAIDPQNASAYDGKGVAFDRAGNHLAAQEMYKQALKFAPDSVAFRNNLAMSFILNNQLKQAIAILEDLTPQTSDNKTVRQNLALAYGLKGERKKALALNMMDVSPEEAKENLKFYDKYSRQRRKSTKPKIIEDQIGFIEPSPEQKNAISTSQPAVDIAPVEKSAAVMPVELIPSAPATKTPGEDIITASEHADLPPSTGHAYTPRILPEPLPEELMPATPATLPQREVISIIAPANTPSSTPPKPTVRIVPVAPVAAIPLTVPEKDKAPAADPTTLSPSAGHMYSPRQIPDTVPDELLDTPAYSSSQSSKAF